MTQLILQGGAAGALAFIVFAFIKGWIVPGNIVSQKDARIAQLEAEKKETQEMISELTSEIRAGTKVQAEAAATVGVEQIDQIMGEIVDSLKKRARRRP